VGVETALIVAAAASAASAAYSGYTQNRNAKFQAKVQEQQANTERQAGELRAEQLRERAKRVAASFRAAGGVSGASLNSETYNLINKDIVQRGEEDAQVTINDANDQASLLRAQAQGLRYQGRNAQTAGLINASSSAISSYAKYG
jgi:hypothetical protein